MGCLLSCELLLVFMADEVDEKEGSGWMDAETMEMKKEMRTLVEFTAN